MKGDEGGVFNNAPDWKPLLLLKIKIKQYPGCPVRIIMLSFNTFIRTLRGISDVKKICTDQWLGKGDWAKRGVGKYVGFVLNTVWESEGTCNARKIFQFFLFLKLGNSISST